jgi:putative transposase
VRLIRRADGYYVQFCVAVERSPIVHVPIGRYLGIDVGLHAFVTDSEGASQPTPRFFRQGEKRLKRLHRRVSRKVKGSKNRQKARKRLAKAYLHVQRQREDHARKLAGTLVSSCDWIVFEDLQIHVLVRNHHLAKSIADAAWGRFLWWVVYYARLHGIGAMAVPPQWTSQRCSGCGHLVRKSLSVRTHRCSACGLILDRDHNAARNILQASYTLNRTAG